MFREAEISDAEIAGLCANFIKSQREEIEQMKKLLTRL
jgi:uncharacterized protein (DUF305 family)